MKRHRIFWLVIVAIVLVAAIRLGWREPRVAPQDAEPEAPSVRSSETGQRQTRASPQRERGKPVAALSREALGKIYMEQSLADPDYDWKIPIEFYGKVIDQDSNAVSGATIEFLWTDLSREGTSRHSTESDERGEFGLTGVRGKSLGVEVSKTGYYRSVQKSRSSFEYANPFEPNFHQPDRANPVVFHLRRKGKAEPLVSGHTPFGFRIDGTPQYLDLAEGKNKRNPPGDIVVRFTRSEDRPDRRYDWTVSFQAPDGGLIETDEEFMFLAPEDGYESGKVITMKADDPDWRAEAKRKFYVRSRNGKLYARLEATIIPRYNQGAAIDLRYFVNVNGSRNLEFDPAVQPKPKFLE